MIQRVLALLCLLGVVLPCCFAAATKPISVKVVVIAMFEVGNDTGDTPGELQYWIERDHLDQVYPKPDAYQAVRMNSAGEMAILTGAGTAHAAAAVIAVGLDPRFNSSEPTAPTCPRSKPPIASTIPLWRLCCENGLTVRSLKTSKVIDTP
jgi:purine nucleoside permease